MVEITLSIQEEHLGSGEVLAALLKQFESEARIRVHLKVFDWEKAWQELVNMAIYQQGADVSQIGSTWLSSLAGMNALAAFSQQDLNSFGGVAQYPQPLWDSTLLGPEHPAMGIPWLGYVRFLYFRRDLLAQTGIPESEAFASPAALAQTLQALSAFTQAPWIAPVTESQDTMHDVAPWLWHYGADFLSPDGLHVRFGEAAALEALTAYFSLHRFLPPVLRTIASNPQMPLPQYQDGEAAVSMGAGNPWLTTFAPARFASPELYENTGSSLPFGKPFIGASHLAIWQHSKHFNAALELIRFLTSPLVQSNYVAAVGLPPVRKEALSLPPLTEIPQAAWIYQALNSGASFPAVPMWGMVEQRFSETLELIWRDILASPDPDVAACVAQHITPLAKRLEITLSNKY